MRGIGKSAGAVEVASAGKLPKDLRNYIRDVESKSGIRIPEEQRVLLAQDLRGNVYTKLEGDALKEHRNIYKAPGVRERLISEREKMGGSVKVREWPRYEEPVYKKSGEILKNVAYCVVSERRLRRA